MPAKKAGIDVAEPGKTPASETSRPIIISKGAMLKDPMMADKVDEKPEPATQTPPSVVRKKLEPIAEQDTETEVKAVEEATPEPAIADLDQDSVDSSLSELSPTDLKSNEKADLEQEKRQSAVDAMIRSRKYFVPIGAEAKRRAGERSAVLISVLILVVVGAIAAIDAGAIDVGYSLPFDIIK